MKQRSSMFDQAATMYDQWFDSPEGSPVSTSIEDGLIRDAGFVAMRFQCPALNRMGGFSLAD